MYILVNESADLSRAMVLWHGREGISEAAGEHSGRQFESCIKFITTTTLPFEIEINSLHLNQPTIQRVISTQHQPTNQQHLSIYISTEFQLHQFTWVSTRPTFFQLLRFAPTAKQENSKLCLIRSFCNLYFRVGSHIFTHVIYVYISIIYRGVQYFQSFLSTR